MTAPGPPPTTGELAVIRHGVPMPDPLSRNGSRPQAARHAAAPSGWADVAAAGRSDRDHRLGVAARAALLLLVSACDLVLIKSTLDSVLRDVTAYSALLACGLTVASVALAFQAGREARVAVAHGRAPRGVALRLALPALAWLALGVGLFVLRWQSTDLGHAALTLEGAGVAEPSEADRERLLASVLAAVYLATGCLSALDGYHLTNPAAAAMRAARRRLADLDEEVAAAEGRYARLVEHLTIARQEIENAPRDLAVALDGHRALAAELKEHARVQVATHLGDPAATGLVRSRPERADDR